MERDGRIVTVGLSPAWDIRCRGRGLDWGRHAHLDDQEVRPAGKALNVSYALAWLGIGSTAAGLWGRQDCEPLQRAVRRLGPVVRLEMTPVDGRTRQNVTVVDTLKGREMHLRCTSTLASEETLGRLDADLKKLVGRGDTCIFAGAMAADALLDPLVDLVRGCGTHGARIVVDTSGPALKRLVDAALPWLITPNVEELCELLNRDIQDTPESLVVAGRTLLDKVDIVLISRGEKGAVLATREGAWKGRSTGPGAVLSTVGCGDYLLAGFLAGFREGCDPLAALTTGLKVATARARGWTETRSWRQAEGDIEILVERL